jgi:hypothetical protein
MQKTTTESDVGGYTTFGKPQFILVRDGQPSFMLVCSSLYGIIGRPAFKTHLPTNC